MLCYRKLPWFNVSPLDTGRCYYFRSGYDLVHLHQFSLDAIPLRQTRFHQTKTVSLRGGFCLVKCRVGRPHLKRVRQKPPVAIREVTF
jgi:hypothetical protein